MNFCSLKTMSNKNSIIYEITGSRLYAQIIADCMLRDYDFLDYLTFFCRTNIKKGKVDISELTWEQKESVLRLLFAKMNGLNRW